MHGDHTTPTRDEEQRCVPHALDASALIVVCNTFDVAREEKEKEKEKRNTREKEKEEIITPM